MLAFARAAALRLSALADPEGPYGNELKSMIPKSCGFFGRDHAITPDSRGCVKIPG